MMVSLNFSLYTVLLTCSEHDLAVIYSFPVYDGSNGAFHKRMVLYSFPFLLHGKQKTWFEDYLSY